MRIQEVLNFEDADEESLEREKLRNELYIKEQDIKWEEDNQPGETSQITANSTLAKNTALITEEENKGDEKDGLPNFKVLYFPDGEEPPYDKLVQY